MPNTQALTTSFKTGLLLGQHAFGTSVTRGTTAADTFKGALYLASGNLGAGTTAYSATDEASGTGYTAGGANITNATAPSSSGTTAFWTPSGALQWTGLTLSAAVDALLIYNATQANRSVGVFTFGALTITSGTLTINFPTNGASTGLVRVA